MPKMTPKEVLLKAAEVISEKGHCKGWYKDEKTGAVCAYGAMTTAVTGNAEYADLGIHLKHMQSKALIDQAAELLAQTLPPLEGWPGGYGPTTFDIVTKNNDLESTTGEDMALWMKKAAYHE